MSATWEPVASQSILRQRAFLYQRIRAFFAEREVLEVETPVLGRFAVTDPHIDCIAVPGHGYLQSSPEYHMKRLLAAGSGAIFQISRVFREGESGRRHNPEFSMLEWYRPGFSLQQLIDELLALVQSLYQEKAFPEGSPDKPLQVRQYSFRQCFAAHTGLDPLLSAPEHLAACAQEQGAPAGLSKSESVDYLMAVCVEPAFPEHSLVVITDFPPWAAALARMQQDSQGEQVAARFEVYMAVSGKAMELANGYHELADAEEQRRRFEVDRLQRQEHGKASMEPDYQLLAALEQGLPDCSGVALGLDRLLMCLSGATSIEQVLTFPKQRS